MCTLPEVGSKVLYARSETQQGSRSGSQKETLGERRKSNKQDVGRADTERETQTEVDRVKQLGDDQ